MIVELLPALLWSAELFFNWVQTYYFSLGIRDTMQNHVLFVLCLPTHKAVEVKWRGWDQKLAPSTEMVQCEFSKRSNPESPLTGWAKKSGTASTEFEADAWGCCWSWSGCGCCWGCCCCGRPTLTLLMLLSLLSYKIRSVYLKTRFSSKPIGTVAYPRKPLKACTVHFRFHFKHPFLKEKLKCALKWGTW